MVGQKLPLWLKCSYTAFMLVLVPVYVKNYGPTNFFYFCDAALFLTLAGIWTGRPIFASMAAVGIMVPQLFWCVDFLGEWMGFAITGMTHYMFASDHSLFLRGLSLYHGWLPFLIMYLVYRQGYDQRAFKAWSVLALALCAVAYFLLPPAGAVLADPDTPRNVNYMFGFDDARMQTWLPPSVYAVVYVLALFAIAWLPTHWLLVRLCKKVKPI